MPTIDPQSSQHSQLKQLVMTAFSYSKERMEKRYPAWKRSERVYRCYVDPNVTDPEAGTKKENPFERHIYIPYGRFNSEILLTYLLSVYTQRSPMFQLDGREPDDDLGAQLWTSVLDYQFNQMNILPLLFTYHLDSLKADFGAIKTTWGVKRKWQAVKKTGIAGLMGLLTGDSHTEEEKIVAEYPETINVDYYHFFPDPRVPLCRFQDGDFVGHLCEGVSWSALMRQKDIYSNLELLKNEKAGTVPFVDRDSDMVRDKSSGIQSQSAPAELGGMHELKELWVRLIPKDYQLGDSDEPEIWVVTLADDKVIIRAEKSVYRHSLFPFNCMEYDYDGHSFLNPGQIEIIEPMQRMMNWLINSRMDNVRRAMNIRAAYDPEYFFEDDLLNPEPMQYLRLKQSLVGRRLDEVYSQLPVVDVTKGNLQDIIMLADIMERSTGAGSALQGKETDVKRTAFEVNQMTQGSLNRFAALSKRMAAQGIKPWIEMCLSNNQQFMTESRFFRIVGSDANGMLKSAAEQGMQVIKDRVFINPEEISDIGLDFVVNDGTLPMDPGKDAKTWIDLMGISAKYGIGLDLFKLAERATMGMGITNLEDFRMQGDNSGMLGGMPPSNINAQLMPDEQIMDEVQKGNLAPI